VSDEVKFASKDELSFEWPLTEAKPKRKKPYIATANKPSVEMKVELKAYHKARRLAKRWVAEDESVTMQDIIDVLLQQESKR
jgi:hypothetical protein